MKQYTPGPWNSERAYGERDTYISGSNTALVCKLIPQQLREETKANAALIAAAPELYEALKEAHEYIRRHSSTSVMYGGKPTILDRIDSALAAAEGK